MFGRSLTYFVFALSAFFAVTTPAAQVETGFVQRVYRDESGEHRYALYVPPKYHADKVWPVVVFLHTNSERGKDGWKPTQVGLGPVLAAAQVSSVPFLVVFPQCEDADVSVQKAWTGESADGQRALAILNEVEKTYSTDKDRVYLTGASMGGFGVWSLGAAFPDRWAAIVPVCGGGDPTWAANYKSLPVWCFHGAEDRAVPTEASRRMIAALEAAGQKPRFSELPGVEHEAWDPVYRRKDLYTWLLQQKRGQAAPAETAPAPPGAPAAAETPEILDLKQPFVSVLDVPNAAYVRLGNKTLSVIGDAVPQLAPPDALRGTLPDADNTTNTQAGPMAVALRGMRYQGELSRASLTPRADGNVLLTLRARNVTVVINRTYIEGSGRSAVCGPMSLQFGHRGDLQINCLVRPAIEQRKLKLKVLDTKFRIPDDNFDVTPPQWVQASGLGMTSERVSSGLVNGFNTDRSRLEQQVVSIVPAALDRMTGSLPLGQADRVVAGMWPLPVYRPRVKSWPSAVSADSQGLTVQLGVSVAAMTEEQSKAGLRTVVLPMREAKFADPVSDFQFAVAPALLEQVAQPLIDARAARLLVVDSPMKKFLPLAQADELAKLVPDLRARNIANVRSELLLLEPIRMRPASSDSNSEQRIELELNKVVCHVAIPAAGPGNVWAPYLEIEFNVRQQAFAELRRPTHSKRAVALTWRDHANVSIATRFASNVTPATSEVDNAKLQEIIAGAWEEWTQTGPLAAFSLDEMSLGTNKLRASQLGWDREYLATTFSAAGMSLGNASDSKVAYSTKTRFSEWGGPYPLDQAKTHAYEVAYPFICRFNSNGKEKMYTLPAGARFEFRQNGAGEIDLMQLSDTAEQTN